MAAGAGELEARQKRKKWLATDRVDGAFDREPLHWPLVFPEVFEGVGSTGSWETRRSWVARNLELNHARYAEEVAAGLYDKKARRPKPAKDDGTLF